MIRNSLSKIQNSYFGVSLLCLLSCLCLSACIPLPCPPLTETGHQNRPVVIDSDLAFDDRMAILYLLKRPEIRIKAITVSAGAHVDCRQKIQALKELLILTKGDGIPTACGSEPSEMRKKTDKTPVELLSSAIQDSPQKVTLLAIGPLTNIADALKISPSLINNIEMITIMGGAINVPGNVVDLHGTSSDPVAEWNFYLEPVAANRVLQSKAPVTLIPLDATNQVPLTSQFIEGLKARPQTAHTSYVLSLLTDHHEDMMKSRLYFWDPLAAAILVDETIAGFEKRHLEVIEENGSQRGRVIIDPAGPEVHVVFRVDRNHFEQHFIDTLAPLSFGHSN